ncbi:iron-containing alcohol dehydrogenase [Streptococcus pneumoniae]|nr:iron-containing alcohol dehydrogenase [Streptococcus pneumoniae]
MATFYVPAVNLIGKGVVNEVGPYIKELGYKKALLVTDKYIEGSDILPKVLKPLDTEGIEYVIFSDVEPNPTCKNVTDGIAALQEHGCDFIISLGGGSPQDAASCISIMATNGGKPQDYEGLHKSAKKGLPVVAINTTAGTSAEITINPNHSYLSQLDVTYKTPDLMSHFLPPHEVSFTFCCSSIVFPR